MKGKYPVSHKAGSGVKFNKHLRPFGKRMVNKSTRKLGKAALLNH